MREGADFCQGCTDAKRERELDRKRAYWHQGPVLARPVDQAAFWLRKQLRRGPVESRELKRRAASLGISLRTLRRAAEKLDVRYDHYGSEQGRGRHRTRWRLP